MLLAVAPARAGALADAIMGPRAMAMGGAHTGLPNDNAALFFNPAGISYGKKYAIELGYQHSFNLKSHLAHVSVVDSKSSKIGGAVSFSYLHSFPDSAEYGELKRTGIDVRAAASYALGDRFFFGITNKLVTRKIDPREADPKNEKDDPLPENWKKYSLDVGLLFAVSNGITIGVSGRNLTLPRTEDLPTELAAGIGIAIGPVGFAADYVADFTTIGGKAVGHSAHGGAEVFLFNRVALRAGYMLNGLTPDDAGGYGFSHWITGGAGYVHKSFAVDAAYKRKIYGVGSDTGDTFNVTLRFFL